MTTSSTDRAQADSGTRAAPLSGVTPLAHLGVMRVEGEDAAKFLQGQLTQDVALMTLDEARLAAFCNAKGRMQASFFVIKRSEADFLLICSRDLLAQTLKRLSMFVLRARAKITDTTSELLLFGLVGDAITSTASQDYPAWAAINFDAQTLVFLPPAAGQPRALWCAPAGTLAPKGAPLSPSIWQWLEVQSGIAMITQPIFEAFVPQMLNYESVGGVNFKKGCYPGQEVVARSQFRGTLKRRAYLMHGDTEGAVGQEVFQSLDATQPCGTVAACAAHPEAGFDFIVSMQTSAAAQGALTLGGPAGPALALLPLPYPLLEDI